jgi:O-antigen/teichoic acid export membrane protein
MIFSGLFNNSDKKFTIKKNVLLLGIIKIFSSLIGFLLVPLVLDYLDANKYGVWLILSSMIGWIGLLDFGIGNGTRNLLGHAFAHKDFSSAKKIISTSFALIISISVVLNIIFLIINPFLNWISILNIDLIIYDEIKNLIWVIFFLISIRMVTGLILAILYVDHRPVVADLIVLVGNVLSFIGIFILSLKTSNSLFYIGLSLTFFSTVSPLIASIWFFTNDYKKIAPSFSSIDFSRIKGFLNQGIQFSILQISTLVLTMTDMIIITQLYSPNDVVPYNISYRLFGYVLVLFGVIVAPFWAAFNNEYHSGNFTWIKKSTKKLFYIWSIVSVGVVSMILVSDFIYTFWIGDKIVIPYTITIFMGIFVIIQIANTILTTFIYSTGKLTVLTIIGVSIAILNIPLCILLAKNFNLGVTGVIVASIICVLFNSFFASIQYIKIVNKNDRGIWSR